MKCCVWLITGMLWVGSMPCTGQVMKEWFQQKKTQKEYLIKQIALYQVYIDYLKRGYKIADRGLKTIHSIKNGEFNLHDAFYKSLLAVNPTVKAYAKGKDILSNEHLIEEITAALLHNEQTKHLSASNRQSIQTACNNVLSDTRKNVNDLRNVLTNGIWKMTDDERLATIDYLYEVSQQLLTFTRKLLTDTNTLIAQTVHEQTEIDYLNSLYGF